MLRTVIVLTSLFIAESVPSFNDILNLLGATVTAITTFIAPSMLYLRLCSMEGDWPKRYVGGGRGGLIENKLLVWDAE